MVVAECCRGVVWTTSELADAACYHHAHSVICITPQRNLVAFQIIELTARTAEVIDLAGATGEGKLPSLGL